MTQNLEDRVKAIEDESANQKRRLDALITFLGKTPYFNADLMKSAIDGPIAKEEPKLGQLM